MKRLGKASSAIFGEDEAPAHFIRDVRQYFDEVIPNQWIGRADAHQMGIIRSPDLSPMDFFLWEYVKNNIYKSTIRNQYELKIKIIEHISSARCFF